MGNNKYGKQDSGDRISAETNCKLRKWVDTRGRRPFLLVDGPVEFLRAVILMCLFQEIFVIVICCVLTNESLRFFFYHLAIQEFEDGGANDF